jgi:hypothetical protein
MFLQDHYKSDDKFIDIRVIVVQAMLYEFVEYSVEEGRS